VHLTAEPVNDSQADAEASGEKEATTDGLGVQQVQGTRIADASNHVANGLNEDDPEPDDGQEDEIQEAEYLQAEIAHEAENQNAAEGDEAVETVDPDAPLADAADQADDYEEAVYEDEDAAKAEGAADAGW
jgi:hypothetical protein